MEIRDNKIRVLTEEKIQELLEKPNGLSGYIYLYEGGANERIVWNYTESGIKNFIAKGGKIGADYESDGIRMLTKEEVDKLLCMECGLTGYLYLNDDGTDAYIGDYTKSEILKFLDNGGRIGADFIDNRYMTPTGIIFNRTTNALDLTTSLGCRMIEQLSYAIKDSIDNFLSEAGIVPLESTQTLEIADSMSDKLLDDLRKSGLLVKTRENPVGSMEYPVPVRTGQHRQWNESGKTFFVGEMPYDDRDFYTCIYDDGSVCNHRETLILTRTTCI